MSSEVPSPGPPPITRPSVFISYASDDRAAARALRDLLATAGLDVWYDENELGGGDAWDQKIRRQIRDCDYFMALVSASTERRKEGYFRREWRLAAERTMDMADDVLFLLPIVIDDTSEAGARVPEKFMTVQWLRAPGGEHTLALAALLRRLLAGEHTAPAPARPPLITRPTAAAATPSDRKSKSGDELPPPPPMPPFPHAPHDGRVGHWFKFCAEVLWWVITAGWLLFIRLPRWLRIILAVWLVLTLFGPCRSTSNPKPKSEEKTPASAAAEAEVERKVSAAAEHVADALAKNPNVKDWAKVGEDLARRFGVTATAANKRLLLLPPLAPRADATAALFAQRVLAAGYGKLLIARPGEADVMPAATNLESDEAVVAAAREKQAEFVLVFRLPAAAQNASTLTARLLRTSDGTVAWNGDFPIVESEAAQVGEKIATAVLAALPAK